jgi:hypothetical protein
VLVPGEPPDWCLPILVIWADDVCICLNLGVRMRRSLSYADAVKMLGGGEIAMVRVLDRFSAVGPLVPGIDLIAGCKELVRMGDQLLTRFGERLHGIDRLTRTERLRAAHAVIVLTAYFDTLQGVFADLPVAYSVRMARAEQISVASGSVDAGLRGIADALLSVVPVQPGSVQSHEATLELLEAFYVDLSGHVTEFVSGLASWEALSETERSQVSGRLRESVPALAVGQYEELFRRLAGDCPEFGIWADMFEHQATRTELRNGLAGLENVLESIASGRVPDQRRATLARTYRAALVRPITPSGEVPADLQIPNLGEGYIDHRIRVAEVGASSEPGLDSWWNDVPVRDDACRFLAGYPTCPAAQETPLILLGQPGSGKSILTRILAARLPAADFLPVRVELRQVPAEADLQDQIEFAVRNATGERVSWPRLAESGDGALPVVMLDGFDELLQATGVTQTDFLLRVLAFQEREADQGRPLAVIVTSRTAVTDRARIPHGAVAVRLEPFNENQVAAWLEVWRRANAAPLAARGMRPLPADVALSHRELAEQPLLLLMLALYDADANALQRQPAELGRTELYGRLLKEFAQREIGKDSPGLPEADLKHGVETELLRLSVVAFAMFNRRSQWVSEGNLNADLSMLLGRQEIRQPNGLRAPLTAAQLAVGRFFFVHESHANRDETRLQTYEFLHATFGEFLVARLVTQILTDMLARETAAASPPLGLVDDGLLHALLSYAALTARAPIVTFLGDLLGRLGARQRQVLTDLLLRLHSRALYPRTESAYNGYQPLELTVTARHAAWSANLVTLAVLAAGQISGSQLFPHDPDPAVPWRNQAMMWRSQLSSEEWYGLHQAIALERVWDGQHRNIRLWRDDGTFTVPAPDIYWTYNIPPGHPNRRGFFAWAGHGPRALARKSNFTAGKSDDFMGYGLQPLGDAFPAVANVFVTLDPDRPVSAVRVLLDALLAPYHGSQADSAYSDLAHVTHELAHASNMEHDYGTYLQVALAVLVSAVERGAASPESLESLIEATSVSPEDPQVRNLLTRLEILLRDRRQALP